VASHLDADLAHMRVTDPSHGLQAQSRARQPWCGTAATTRLQVRKEMTVVEFLIPGFSQAHDTTRPPAQDGPTPSTFVSSCCSGWLAGWLARPPSIMTDARSSFAHHHLQDMRRGASQNVPPLCRAVGPSRRRSERKGLGAGSRWEGGGVFRGGVKSPAAGRRGGGGRGEIGPPGWCVLETPSRRSSRRIIVGRVGVWVRQGSGGSGFLVVMKFIIR
jgi:hypothetical protein